MNLYIKFVLVMVIFLTVDIIYLKSISEYFTKHAKKMKLRNIYNPISFILVYVALFIVLYHFILKNINLNKSLKLDILKNAFILGFCIYAVFDLTNYTLFKNWPIPLIIIDSLWGGLLFSIVTILYHKLMGILSYYV